MAQNSFVLDEIDREATKVRADAHLQKSLPGKGIPLKTTQAFLKIFKELYSAISKPICESSYFQCIKFSKFFVRFVMLLIAPALFDLIIAHYIKKQEFSRSSNAKWIQDTDYILQGKIHQLGYFIFGRLNVAILFNCVFPHAHYIE